MSNTRKADEDQAAIDAIINLAAAVPEGKLHAQDMHATARQIAREEFGRVVGHR